MRSAEKSMSVTAFILSLLGIVALLCLMFGAIGRGRTREFDASPPRETTWQASIHSNTWDPSLSPGTPCEVRMKEALLCRRGCSTRSTVEVRCDGRRLVHARDTHASPFVKQHQDHLIELEPPGGTHLLWDTTAGTLILELRSTLEPRRLALRLAPSPMVEIDASCRSSFGDIFGIDSTPRCAYTYLEL